MTAFKILGVTISPLHCKNADVREFNCENGIISEYTKKYAVASVSYTHLDVYKRQDHG